ncbi:hypothetical protein [Streptomyces chartreusis]|uniref:hypothetical protein n=1 Tax=Streptomyces chartreusis TaxID=1969 RepID=UPI003446EC08
MALISPGSVEEAARQTAPYNHPHFESGSRHDFDSIVWKLKPFTGLEKEPTQLPDPWRYDRLSEVLGSGWSRSTTRPGPGRPATSAGSRPRLRAPAPCRRTT